MTQIICPRAAENGATLSAMKPPFNGEMVWREDKTCSYCGSLNPEEFMARLEAGDVELGPTDKPYKVYIKDLEGKPVGGPAGKFYFQHTPFPVRWNPFTNLFEAEGYEPPVSPDTATGWADYADTQYTSGSPLSVLADTDTLLPNNGLGGVKTQEPSDGPFYADGKITGREGDGLLITVDFKVTPTNANTTLLEVWFDIGGSVGELYRRPITFPKGNGVERGVNFTVAGYTLDTWEANGAEVYVRANGTCEIHTIRYVLTRTHKAAIE